MRFKGLTQVAAVPARQLRNIVLRKFNFNSRVDQQIVQRTLHVYISGGVASRSPHVRVAHRSLQTNSKDQL
jgi:hypothetical protein